MNSLEPSRAQFRRDKITDLERDLVNLRPELDEGRRRLEAIEPRANRAHNFLWTKIHETRTRKQRASPTS